ncbi:MAG: branched-chain amino acid ABC transporter permease [Clostridiales Family XIII bacterium]|jgi:branched-chain amino acid transport system permease protein|nr:branched-chain amino acid ABC transporter permease [Clostridiales Family XIII bacterium]
MQLIIQIAISGLLMGGIYSMVSMGLSLIYGVTGIVNFAHGEFLMVAMFLTWGLNSLLGLDPYISVILVVPLMFLIGMLVEKTVIEPIIKAPHSMQIMATAGLSTVLANGALMLMSANYRSVITGYSSKTLNMAGIMFNVPKLVGFFAAVALTVLLALFLKRTYTGRAITATAQDMKAAQLMGINIKRIYLIAFGLGTACVGVAGVVLMPMYYVFPSLGTYFCTTAFVIVVLGGMGNIYGAFVGGLVIGMVEAFSGYLLAPVYKEVVYFVIFIIILIVKPSGILGRSGRAA